MGVTKRYICIAKLGNNPNGTAKAMKRFVNNLLSYTKWLDTDFPEWRWFNVYDKETGQQLASFTKYRKPMTKHL